MRKWYCFLTKSFDMAFVKHQHDYNHGYTLKIAVTTILDLSQTYKKIESIDHSLELYLSVELLLAVILLNS